MTTGTRLGEGGSVKRSRSAVPFFFAFFILLIFAVGTPAFAQTPDSSLDRKDARIPQTTLAIFTDRSLTEGLWNALMASLHEELSSGSPEIQELVARPAAQPRTETSGLNALSSVQIIRGDEIKPGMTVDSAVTVYLQGECKTTPVLQFDAFGKPERKVTGVLGWVSMTEGHIDPFIHVDCTRIGQMLVWRAAGRSQQERDRLIADAISRVVLHEWIHIATQSARHSRHGIEQAQFSVADLLAHSSKPVEHHGTPVQAVACDSGAGFGEPPGLRSLSPWQVRGAK